MNGRLLVAILCFMLFTISSQAAVLIQKGNVESGYILEGNGQKMLLSLDGSEAEEISSGTKLNLPGNYYVSYYNKGGLDRIENYTVPYVQGEMVHVQSEAALDEVLRSTLAQQLTTVSFIFEQNSSSGQVVQDMIEKHLQTLVARYPMLSYSGGNITVTTGKQIEVTVQLTYPTSDAVCNDHTSKLRSVVHQMINNKVTKGMTDYDIELILFKTLIESVSYGKNAISEPILHTMLGALINHQAVCDGYAKSMMYLLNIVGVPTRLITGKTVKGEDHAWNLVKVQGNYYHVDSTWADLDGQTIGVLPRYFNEQDSFMKQTHIWTVSAYPAATISTYCTPFTTKTEKGVYKVNSTGELNKTLMQAKKDGAAALSLVLYHTSQNKWQEKYVAERITQTFGKAINYYSESKYDCLLLHVKVKG